MSGSKPELSVQGINEQSSVSEMISTLRQSFQAKYFDEVERLMLFREKKLQTELSDLKKDFDSLRGEHDSLKSHYSRAVSDKAKVEQELMNCKCHLKESRQQLEKLNGTCEQLRQTAKKAYTRYKCIAEELTTVEMERGNKLAEMNEELAKKDEELKKVKEENDTSLAEMTDKLAKRDAEFKVVKEEIETLLAEMTDKLAKKDEELKVVKEENETSLAEMTEMLAKKDREYNQLWTERNITLKDLVARILFLEEDVKKYDVENLSPAMSVHKGSSDGVDSAVVGENGGPEVEPLQNAVYKQAESEKIPNTLPTLPGKAEPSTNIPVIDLSSDDENEGLVSAFGAKAVSTFENGNNNRLKRERSGSCTSDSDDSLAQTVKGKRVCEVQDTAQSNGGKTWLDLLFEKEKLRTEN